MRVIAGHFRGRQLKAPAGTGTRPILDRVKVALFDWLGSRLAQPGSLPPLNILDIFCGGGSLGIEAMSRGARFCTFVEQDCSALSALRDNIAMLAVPAASFRIVSGPAEFAPIPRPPEGYGLVFLDPPYRLTEETAPGSVMARVLGRLSDQVPLSPDALIVWRHEARQSTPDAVAGRRRLERRAWGTLAITLYGPATEGAP